MRVIIVEDEELAARELDNMLQQVHPPVQVQAKLETVHDTIEWLQNNEVDLIFMDIHLGDGNSFQVFEQINVNIPVIFTTAFDAYALQSYKYFGVDYLLKPFDLEDVQAAINKVKLLKASANVQHERLGIVGEQLKEVQERFMVSAGTRLKSIPAEKVAYFMAEGKHLFLFSAEGQKYIIDDTLANLEPKLLTKDFFRINRKFIIGFGAIKEMMTHTRGRTMVRLQPEPPTLEPVLVSTERGQLFKRWLSR